MKACPVNRNQSVTINHVSTDNTPDWIRTNGRPLRRRLLYPLSYGRLNAVFARVVLLKCILRNHFSLFFCLYLSVSSCRYAQISTDTTPKLFHNFGGYLWAIVTSYSDRLTQNNALLKSSKTKVSIFVRGNKLWLRASLSVITTE